MHKHYEMIMAKAENMELTVLYKPEGVKWTNWVGNKKAIFFTEDEDYFLCHQKHTEACLHWLNGGKVNLYNRFRGMFDVNKYNGHRWEPDHIFMSDTATITIEVKKREKWIIYRTDGSIVGPFDKEPENITGNGQIIKIEVV